MRNKYSIYKLAMFPDKIKALSDGVVTAPLYVRFKPTNRCNHACRWCVYHHGGEYGGQMHGDVDLRDHMPAEKAIALIAELGELGVKAITFSGGGEPLAHPAIVAMLQTAREGGMATSIITNGQLLTGDRAGALSDAAWVRVSIDYWDEDSFHQSRQVEPRLFDQVCDNIQSFGRCHSGDLGVNFIVTEQNHEHLLDVCVWLRGLGVDHVRFSPVWVDDFCAYHEGISGYVHRQLEYAAENLQGDKFKVYSSYRIDPGVKIRGYDKCYFQQIVPVIGADQCVYACHNTAYTASGLIGSVRNQTFADLWFSPQTEAWFREFNASSRCNGIQCAADAKNRWYNQIMDLSDDAFV